MLPAVVSRDVCAARIDIRVQIITDAVGLQVRFFEDDETSNFQWHFAIGNPCCVEAMCATAHVNNVAMGRGSVTAAHCAKPDVVEVPDGSAKEGCVEIMHLGSEDDAVDGGLVLPGGRVKLGMNAFLKDAFDERLAFFKNPILCERLDESLAGFENDLTGEESFNVKVSVFIHAPLEGGRIIADGGGILQPAEGVFIYLKFMTEGCERAVGGVC